MVKGPSLSHISRLELSCHFNFFVCHFRYGTMAGTFQFTPRGIKPGLTASKLYHLLFNTFHFMNNHKSLFQVPLLLMNGLQTYEISQHKSNSCVLPRLIKHSLVLVILSHTEEWAFLCRPQDGQLLVNIITVTVKHLNVIPQY